jgi:hypothetical protein
MKVQINRDPKPPIKDFTLTVTPDEFHLIRIAVGSLNANEARQRGYKEEEAGEATHLTLQKIFDAMYAGVTEIGKRGW